MGVGVSSPYRCDTSATLGLHTSPRPPAALSVWGKEVSDTGCNKTRTVKAVMTYGEGSVVKYDRFELRKAKVGTQEGRYRES